MTDFGPNANANPQAVTAGEVAEAMRHRMKALREGLGLSQNGVSSLMHIPPGPMSMWESGRPVPVKYLAPLASALSTNVPYLLSGVGDPSADSIVPDVIDAALEDARAKIALAMGVDLARVSVRFDVVETP